MAKDQADLIAKLTEFEELIDSVNDIIYTHDLDGNMLSANQSAVDLLGYPLEDVLKLNIRDIVDADHLPLAMHKIREKASGSAERTAPYELLCWAREGREVWLEVSTRIIGDRITGIARDVTDRRKYMQRLEELSIRDPLTELYNQRYFWEALEKETAKVERYRRDLCLMLINIDDLRRFNDTYGHQLGDEVIKALGGQIAHSIRTVDYGCRNGGDEFTILLPESSIEPARTAGERLRFEFERTPFEIMDLTVHCTISAGLAQYRQDEGQEAFYKRAHEAMSLAKQAGKNQMVIADAQMDF